MGGGIYLFVGKLKFLDRSTVAEGVVSKLEPSSSSKNGRTYYPVVTYRDSKGQDQSFTSHIGSSPASYEVGEPVQVRYEPGKPYTAMIVGFLEMWGLIALAAGIGVLFLVISVGILYAAIRLNRLRADLPKTGRMIALPGRTETLQSKSKTEFFIRSQWHNPENGKIYLFDSEKFFFDPTPFLSNRLVEVWIDPQNPKKRYYLDASFLPVEA